MTDSILAMEVPKVTLLLPSPQQVLEERWMLRTGDSNLLGTSSSLASVWLLQSTELLRVRLGPGSLNSVILIQRAFGPLDLLPASLVFYV